MKSAFKLLAGAATATLMAVSAQAATFDFSFYAEQDGIIDVGSGELSFTGDAVAGTQTTFSDLDDLTYSFTIDGREFDQDDARFLFLAESAIDILEFDGEIFLRFSQRPFVPIDVSSIDVTDDIAFPVIDKACAIGALAIVNELNECVSFERQMTTLGLDTLGATGSFFVSPGFDQEQFALGDLGRFSGSYIARLASDVAAVPLPASLPLLLAALGGMGYIRTRRN